VLRGQRVVTLRRDMPQPRGARASSRGTAGSGSASAVPAGTGKLAAADLSPEQEAVFEELRAWRGATAKEQSVPAYVVFHDATLRAIAVAAPSTLAELAGINGVGESKLTKYGESILELLASLPASVTRPRRGIRRSPGTARRCRRCPRTAGNDRPAARSSAPPRCGRPGSARETAA